MTDPEEPRQFVVHCMNAKDGCRGHVHYMGTRPVRKLCSACLKSGAPSERISFAGFNFDLERKRPLAKPKIPLSYSGSEAIYEITVQSKTFGRGGRVTLTPMPG